MVVVDSQTSSNIDDPDVLQGVLEIRDDSVQPLEELFVDGDIVDGGSEMAVEAHDPDHPGGGA